LRPSDGLLSYNGCLVGCASAVFFPSLVTATAVTLAGASAATFATVCFGRIIPQMPQWTYGFNAVMLATLLATNKASLRVPHLPETDATQVTATTSIDVVTEATTITTISALELMTTIPLKGLSQVFLVDSSIAGLGVMGAIAMYSPQLAGHAVMGSAIGTACGYFLLDGTADALASGLWGYNSALTSMAVAFCTVPTRSSLALSAGGAVATAVCYAAIQNAILAPCLTLPFCLTMSACYQLAAAGSITGLKLAISPHSPEKNTA